MEVTNLIKFPFLGHNAGMTPNEYEHSDTVHGEWILPNTLLAPSFATEALPFYPYIFLVCKVVFAFLFPTI